ncbi:MAG: hypothetical protein HBSIN02_25460 [Bacteroidia bacterium]|nr:MAG: hypothetical protein HBSIN02_25460 [Bacteroidia bacterium]
MMLRLGGSPSTQKGLSPPRYAWLRSLTSEGVHLIGGISDTDTLLTERIEYKYPAAVGNSWDVRTIAYSLDSLRFYDRDTLTYSLKSTDAEIQTPAGTFRCYLYQFSKRPADDVAAVWDYKYYLVPGKGLVGYFAVSQSDSTIKEKSLLWKYRIQ